MVNETRLDRTQFEVANLESDPGDREYWRTRTPEERLLALELMRQIHYGYYPATARLQRVFVVVDLT